jgi:hypothetical protein
LSYTREARFDGLFCTIRQTFIRHFIVAQVTLYVPPSTAPTAARRAVKRREKKL